MFCLAGRRPDTAKGRDATEENVQPHGANTRKRGKRILLFVTAGVLLLVAGALGFLWLSQTPHYSLYRLQRAVAHRNAAAVFRYIDVDMIVDRLAAGYLAQQAQTTPKDEIEAALASLARGSLRQMLPSLKESVKAQIVTQILAADEELLGHLRMGNILALDIRQEDKEAFVALRDDRTRQARMVQEADGHWKVVELLLPEIRPSPPSRDPKK